MTRKNIGQELLCRLEKKVTLLEEGTLLSSEQALAEEFGVSKPILRRALEALVGAGVVIKENGIGTRVAKRQRIIGGELVFLCHDLVFFASALRSFSEAAISGGYQVSIVPLLGDSLDQERMIESLITRQPIGVVVYADPGHYELDAYQRLCACLPVVFLMRKPREMESNLITFGNADGLTEIVTTFYDQGCRRIALYGSPGVNPAATLERTAGFEAGMKRCRLKPNPEHQCLPDASEKQRRNFFQMFKSDMTRPDAVCCLNDASAGRLMQELTQQAISITGIRFSGFDHSALSDFLPLPLLTVEPPLNRMGRSAAKLLIRQIENPGFAPQQSKIKAGVILTGKAEGTFAMPPP